MYALKDCLQGIFDFINGKTHMGCEIKSEIRSERKYMPMHEKYMRMALELAEKARGRTNPNPMVGAVLLKDGQIIGQGYHKKAGTPHAEIHALKEAGEKAKGSTLYVTLEPCSHYGRTPPCSEAVIKAGISEVFVAMQDPNPLVAGRGIKLMTDAGIKVNVGLFEKEARELNEVFIKYITQKTPFVLLKTAMTLDGKIATRTGHARWITGSAAREHVHRLRDQLDAILVGVNTVITDNPALTSRLPEGGRDPIRIILDSQARTPVDSLVLTQDSDAPTYIVVTDQAPQVRVKSLSEGNAKILRINSDKNGRIQLNNLLLSLGQLEITSLLVEGGATVAAAFLEEQLVDKVLTFIAPKIVGGADAPTPVAGHGVEFMDRALCLSRTKSGKIGEDFFIEGYPEYNE